MRHRMTALRFLKFGAQGAFVALRPREFILSLDW
jgi:hypothetical protein